MSFQIRALSRQSFEHLFAMSNEELAHHRAIRERVTKTPGTPCRVSLQDADPGEDVLLLLHYTHQPADSPFHASHAIYVRINAVEAKPSPTEIPAFLRPRLLSLRAFNNGGIMLEADVTPGTGVEHRINDFLTNPATSYIHIHNAKQGCYMVRVDRA